MNEKPKILILLTLILILCVGIRLTTTQPNSPTAPTPAPVPPKPLVINLDELFALTNSDRVANNLPALTRDLNLDASASDKCADMITKDYWSHDNPDGSSHWYQFLKNHEADKVYGENLSRGYYTSPAVNTAFMNSTEHRDNILNVRFSKIGLATCKSPNYTGSGPDTLVIEHFAG